MKRFTFAGLFSFILFSCLFVGCSNSYENMIEVFDKKYFSKEPPAIPEFSVYNDDFDEADMLDASYIFPTNTYINLEAPADGLSYSWNYVDDNNEEHEFLNTRLLYFKTPGPFKEGEENTLVLKVSALDENNNPLVYTDRAIVFLKKNNVSANKNTSAGQNLSKDVCTLSIGINDSYSARTINPESLSDNPEVLNHFVLKGVSVTTGAELNNGEGIDLSAGLTSNPPVAEYEIPFGAWELTLEAGIDSEVLLKGRQYVDLKTPRDEINFVLKTDNVRKAGSVSIKGSFVDDGNVAGYYDVGLYSLSDGSLKYPETMTLSAVTEKSFVFEQTSVLAGRYSLIVNFYDSDEEENLKVGYWEDIVVVDSERKTERTDIECNAIINQPPQKPAKLNAYSVDNSVTSDKKYFTARLKWTDSSTNEESFVLTIYECKGKNDTDYLTPDQPYKVYTVRDEDKDVADNLVAGSQQCDIQLPCERYFMAIIQTKNYVGVSTECTYESDNAGNAPDGTKGFGGKTIWYKP